MTERSWAMRSFAVLSRCLRALRQSVIASISRREGDDAGWSVPVRMAEMDHSHSRIISSAWSRESGWRLLLFSFVPDRRRRQERSALWLGRRRCEGGKTLRGRGRVL